MRFTLSSALLSSKLNQLSKVISSKNSISILSCFMFEINNGQLTLTASDNNNMMRYYIPLNDFDGNGSFCISSKMILSAVKELADQPVSFEVSNDYNIRLVYQNGSYRLIGQSAEDYPLLKNIEGPYTSANITEAALSRNIQRTIFAAAVNEEIRLVMSGLCFDLQEENLNIVASDGHKLVRNMIFNCKTELPASFILPIKPASLLRNVLSTNDENTVAIRFDDKNAEFEFSDGILSCLLIEGTFPKYNKVIPTDNPNVLTIDRRAFLGALRRVMPFANENTELIKLRLSQSNLELITEDVDFASSAQEDIVCDYNGVPMTIGFKGSALSDILNNLSSDDVIIELGDPSRAGVIRPSEQPENEDVLMLIMPMIVND